MNDIRIKFLLILILLIVGFKTLAQKNDLQRDHLKGKVRLIKSYTNSKLVRSHTYNAAGFITSTKLYCSGTGDKICSHDTSIFDVKGNKIKNIDDSFITERKFDSENNLIEEIQLLAYTKTVSNKLNYKYINSKLVKSEQTKYQFNSKVVDFTIVTEFTYNSNGNLIEDDNTHTVNGYTTHYKTLYEYNKDRNLIKQLKSNARGEIVDTQTYKYDTVKNKIEYNLHLVCNHANNGYNEYYKYDSNRHLIEISHYNLIGKLIYKDAYGYDQIGNKTYSAHYVSDGLTAKTIDTYKDRLLTEETEYRTDIPVLKKTFEYDTAGNVISSVHMDGKGHVILKLNYIIDYY